MRGARSILLLALLLLAPGCASFVSAQRPVVQEKGEVQVAAAPAFIQGYGTTLADPPAGVNLVVAGRVGLGNGWELGARGWFAGGSLEVNRELLATDVHHLLVGARFIAQSADLQLIFEGAIPLLYGYRIGAFELVGGLEARVQYWPDASVLSTVFSPGAIFGVAWISDSGFYVMPELSFHLWPPAGTWFYQTTVSVGF